MSHQGVSQQPAGPPPAYEPTQGQPAHYPPVSVPGFEVLSGTNRIVVKQKKEMFEIITSWESNNRYEIFNADGQKILYALEDTSTLSKIFLGAARPFCIRILDKQGQQVMVVQSNVSFFTRQVTVEIPPGHLAAQIEQKFALMHPSFYINNPGGSLMFKVKSPMSAAIGSVGNVNFDILSSDKETVIGQITKQWGGFFKEVFTDAETFGLSVPADMDVLSKAVLLAVTFVVDFEFYEKDFRLTRGGAQ